MCLAFQAKLPGKKAENMNYIMKNILIILSTGRLLFLWYFCYLVWGQEVHIIQQYILSPNFCMIIMLWVFLAWCLPFCG